MFKRFIRNFYIRKKIKQANTAFLETGKRHFVIKVAGNKLMVVNNEFLKEFNRLTGKHITSKQMSEHSIYYTR